MAAEGYFGQMIGRVKDWREERESKRMRKRVEEIKIAGRRPAPAQSCSARRNRRRLRTSRKKQWRSAACSVATTRPAVINSISNEIAAASKKSPAPEPKIAKGKTSYRLPSPGLLQIAERSEKMDETELKDCARAIEQKSDEFDVGGHITQINPGPGGHHVRIQA